MKTLSVRTKQARALLLTDFIKLLNGQLLALRIYPFANEVLCNAWTTQLQQVTSFQRYTNAQDVAIGKLGMTLFETENKPDLLQDYFHVGKILPEQMQAVFQPQLNPIERVQAQIHATWPYGATVNTLHGKSMCPGIIRRFEASNSEGLPPHQDMLHKDLEKEAATSPLLAQLAVNLYIEVPDEGGELEIWSLRPTKEEAQGLYTGVHDFINREKLPEPDVLKPRAGELILFRSDCIHSVRGIKDQNRTAASCFLGYYGPNEPIRYWA